MDQVIALAPACSIDVAVVSVAVFVTQESECIMSIKVQIPTPMREQSGGHAEVAVTGATVQAALDDLLRQYPALAPKLFDNGRLRPYVNVFVNDEDIRYLDEMNTALTDGQIIALIPAVAGG